MLTVWSLRDKIDAKWVIINDEIDGKSGKGSVARRRCLHMKAGHCYLMFWNYLTVKLDSHFQCNDCLFCHFAFTFTFQNFLLPPSLRETNISTFTFHDFILLQRNKLWDICGSNGTNKHEVWENSDCMKRGLDGFSTRFLDGSLKGKIFRFVQGTGFSWENFQGLFTLSLSYFISVLLLC